MRAYILQYIERGNCSAAVGLIQRVDDEKLRAGLKKLTSAVPGSMLVDVFRLFFASISLPGDEIILYNIMYVRRAFYGIPPNFQYRVLPYTECIVVYIKEFGAALVYRDYICIICRLLRGERVFSYLARYTWDLCAGRPFRVVFHRDKMIKPTYSAVAAGRARVHI